VRASRLLSLLLLLQNRGRMTAAALARELEVSVRTIHRDVESLAAAGVPVYADRGRHGGYQLVDGYRTRLTGLTTDEADSLFLAGAPGPAAELGLGGALAAAQLKLSAALPPELRDRAARVGERFHLDAPGWFRDADETPFLAPVAEAVWEGIRVRMRYRRWGNDEIRRELDPLGLVLKAGVWYLAAIASGRDEPRTYRVSRVLELESTGERFSRPEGFDLAQFWQQRSEDLRERLWRGTATVRLSPHGAQRLPLLLGSVESRAARESAGEPDAQGWVEVVLPIESMPHAESTLLRLGADAEVVEPLELRDRMAQTARAMTARYHRVR
jgi:predicted DNA-binding transcriptional regulator YafY